MRLSLENLLTFPWIREAVEAGRLRLHGAHFGIPSGELRVLDGSGRFVPVPDTGPEDQRPFGGSNL